MSPARRGDATLFIRGDHIEEAWRIIDPVLHTLGNSASPPVHIYKPGIWGPKAADEFLSQDGRRWLQVCGVHGGRNA